MKDLIYLVLCLCLLAAIIWGARKWIAVQVIQWVVVGLCGLVGALLVIRFVFKLFGFASPV